MGCVRLEPSSVPQPSSYISTLVFVRSQVSQLCLRSKGSAEGKLECPWREDITEGLDNDDDSAQVWQVSRWCEYVVQAVHHLSAATCWQRLTPPGNEIISCSTHFLERFVLLLILVAVATTVLWTVTAWQWAVRDHVGRTRCSMCTCKSVHVHMFACAHSCSLQIKSRPVRSNMDSFTMNENTEIILQHCVKPVYVCVTCTFCIYVHVLSVDAVSQSVSQCFECFPLVYRPLLVETEHMPQTWTGIRW